MNAYFVRKWTVSTPRGYFQFIGSLPRCSGWQQRGWRHQADHAPRHDQQAHHPVQLVRAWQAGFQRFKDVGRNPYLVSTLLRLTISCLVSPSWIALRIFITFLPLDPSVTSITLWKCIRFNTFHARRLVSLWPEQFAHPFCIWDH